MPCSKIKTVKYLGKQRTIDITVNSSDHIYFANGMATSNSHSIGYAYTGYWTAWVKAHLPYHYVCAWLRNAKNKQKPLEEIRSVISESRRLGIDILPPSIKNVPATNFFIKDKSVYFGLDSIKGCGEKSIAKLIELDIDLESMSWLEFLVLYSKLINKTNIINMIRTGCFDYMGRSRMECEFMYNQWAILTVTENRKIIDLYKRKLHVSLTKLLGDFLEEASKNRKPVIQSIIDTLQNAPVDLNDSKDNIVAHEKQLMGINVSCSKIDKAEIPDGKDQCANVDKTKLPYYVLVGEITDLKEFKIKNGKMVGEIMANFKLTDDSGKCDCVIFPNKLNYYQGAIYDGNVIMIKGKKSNRSGLIVEECFEV